MGLADVAAWPPATGTDLAVRDSKSMDAAAVMDQLDPVRGSSQPTDAAPVPLRKVRKAAPAAAIEFSAPAAGQEAVAPASAWLPGVTAEPMVLVQPGAPRALIADTKRASDPFVAIFPWAPAATQVPPPTSPPHAPTHGSERSGRDSKRAAIAAAIAAARRATAIAATENSRPFSMSTVVVSKAAQAEQRLACGVWRAVRAGTEQRAAGILFGESLCPPRGGLEPPIIPAASIPKSLPVDMVE